MGFFDSILTEDDKAATATAPMAKTPAQQKADEGASLIITANDVPNTVLSDMTETEAPAMTIITEESIITDDAPTIMVEEPMIIVDETPTIMSEEPMIITEEVAEEPKTEVVSESIDTEVAPVVVAPVEEEKVISSIFTLDREALSASEDSSIQAILGDAVSRLEKLQKAKELERDEMLATVEAKNAAIAQLKKEAKDLLDKSKEISEQAQKITDMMSVFRSQKVGK